MIDLKNLIKELDENTGKELKTFDQLIEYYQSYNDRNLIIGDITPELAIAIDSVIRFWNKYDEEEKIEPKERKPIKLYIHSPGGYLTSAFTIIDSIKLSKTDFFGGFTA